ncbi:MAG: DUF2207 domain-containing protein, partial [Propionibacteriaceae bacterium]|nr:DUF2207 domain-containing protein [Propionibacteriaceae bacterium]
MKQFSVRAARWLLASALLVGFLVGGPGLPAHAVDEVASQTSTTTIDADGSLEVTATFAFEDAPPAELVQRFRVREELIGERDYVFEITDLRATAGGQDVGTVEEQGEHVVLTIAPGDAQEVTVTYRVRGAAVVTAGGETLIRWDVLQGLSVPVAEVSGELVIPGQFTDFKCVAGPPGTQSACDLAEGAPHDSLSPRFADGPRGAGEIVGARITFPTSLVAANEVIDERWTVGRAFTGTGWPLIAALATLVAGGIVLYLLHRRAGRDAHPSGDPIEVGRFQAVGAGEVEFVPLREVLPGEVGTVVDERVDPIDVTATILDLAVHGQLLIEEQPRRSEFAPTDWALHRRDGDASQLRAYELDLLDALVPEGDGPLLVSKVGQAVADAIPQVQSDLYDEVVTQGFFERRPDSTRNVWNSAALVLLVIGVLATIGLAAFTTFGLTGLALVAVGLGLAFVAQEMPARTEKGARLLAGLGVLRSQLLTQPTDQMPRGRELHELSEVLPYAIVLGGLDRWLDALVAADDDDLPDSTDLSWFNGPDNWHLSDLPDS